MRRDLAADAKYRNRIADRIQQPGDRIAYTGTRSDQHDAGLTGRARITFRRMDGGLLVPDQDMADTMLRVQRVLHRQYGAARITENGVDPPFEQGIKQQLRTP